MSWTKEVPINDGYYFWKDNDGSVMLSLIAGKKCKFIGDDFEYTLNDNFGGEWSEPIKEPPA